MLAVLHGSMECVDLLVRCGARLNVVDQLQNSMLQYAIESRNQEVLQYLLVKNKGRKTRYNEMQIHQARLVAQEKGLLNMLDLINEADEEREREVEMEMEEEVERRELLES